MKVIHDNMPCTLNLFLLSQTMGDCDCGGCDCGDCGDCDCGDCDCGGDCCGDICKILTCNGCHCDCCGCDCCDGNGSGHGGCYPAYFCCVTSDLDCCESTSRSAARNSNGTYTSTNPPANANQFTNIQNQNRRNQEGQVPNGEPKKDEVVTVQPPTYEEAVSMDQPVSTQPQIAGI